MTTAKEYLTGDLTSAERERLEEQMVEFNEEFLDALPEMRQALEDIADGKPVELEERSVTITMPKIFWEMSQKFTDLYKVNEQLLVGVPEEQQKHLPVFKAFSASGKLTLNEVIISQAVTDSLLLFINDIAKIELIHRFQDAFMNNDVEALMKVVQRMKQEKIDAPTESPDDPEKN